MPRIFVVDPSKVTVKCASPETTRVFWVERADDYSAKYGTLAATIAGRIRGGPLSELIEAAKDVAGEDGAKAAVLMIAEMEAEGLIELEGEGIARVE